MALIGPMMFEVFCARDHCERKQVFSIGYAGKRRCSKRYELRAKQEIEMKEIKYPTPEAQARKSRKTKNATENFRLP